MRHREQERGAAAVEFALIFPLIVILLLVVIEFSRVWNIQATISDSARIAARNAAVYSSDPDMSDEEAIEQAEEDASNIPSFVDWSATSIDIALDCEGSGLATSTVSTEPGSLSGWFASALDNPISLTANGRMPCGG